MPEGLSVQGIGKPMGGTKESVAKFGKHHKEVGDALLNISGIGTGGVILDQDDPRPPHTHEPFPMMIYHAEKGELIVFSVDDLAAAKKKGYREEPYLKPQIAVHSPEIEKKALQDQNQQLQGQITAQNDLLAKALARLELLEGKK